MLIDISSGKTQLVEAAGIELAVFMWFFSVI
jgi:hypothetical protein